MDILDIFWTFYLNYLSPLWGYFYFQNREKAKLKAKNDIFRNQETRY